MTITLPNPFRLIVLDEHSHIGLHILKKRLELGNTQKNVATLLGVKETAINNWEGCKVIPRAIYASKIIEFLGYDPFSFKTETLAQRIRTYRIMNGYTLQEFRKIVGVSECTLVSWESGEFKPRRIYMRILDKLLKGC